MKIALVTQHFAPHFEGGTEAVVRAQARELLALGHDVRVVSGTDRPFGASENGSSAALVDGLHVDFLHRRPDEPYDLILERPRLARRVAALCADADLVHLHHWTTLDNSLVRALSSGGRPVVVSLHDHFTSCPRFFRIPAGGVERCPEPGDHAPCVICCGVEAPLPPDELAAGLAARARAFRAELAAAAALIAPSRAHAGALERALGADALAGRLQVVPHGLLYPIARIDAPSRPRPLRVLHLGHRARVKGTLDLVAAIAALPERLREQVWLLCLGAEVERGFDAALKAAAAAAAGTITGVRVALEGPYDAAALSSAVTARGGAHLAAFPSRAPESYGLVVDEALALGLPCLVADSGALPERIGAAGRVLPAGDPGAWTRALADVLEAPERLAAWRAALPANARTAADAAAELATLYERLLSAAQPT